MNVKHLFFVSGVETKCVPVYPYPECVPVYPNLPVPAEALAVDRAVTLLDLD